MSVIRAVDGQDTGLSAQPAQQPTSDWHRPGLSSSERTGPGFGVFKASADRPAQKNATFDVISFRPNHEAGHMFSPTRKVGSAFFRTHIYCDSSPCFTDPALLSVVGFCGLKSCRLSITQRTRPLTSSPVSQSRVLPTKSRSWSRVFTDQEGRKCVLQNSHLL